MHTSTRAPRQQDVTNHHDLLALRRNALEAESRADDAFVHHATMCERRFLAVIRHRDAEGARILQRRAHQLRTHHRTTVIADGDRTGGNHLAHLAQLHAVHADRDRADRVHARGVRLRGLRENEADGGLVVGDRIRVRHRAHRGEAACRRRSCAGRDRLHILAARLPQVAMHVDETRRDMQSTAVDTLRLVGPRDRAADRRHQTVDQQDVADAVQTDRWVQQVAAGEQQGTRGHSRVILPRPCRPLRGRGDRP